MEQVDPRSDEARLLRLNLDRARALPPSHAGRHVVVDAAGARLLMYEGDRVAGTMKVIVGKDTDPTPEMAAYIRYASVNPYWNIPPDLTERKIAPLVVKEGLGHLRKNGYEVMSDWSTKATVANPKLVDWKAVAAGRQQIRLRQRPGPLNGMGKVKFMFPNDLGIYLHDTPDRGLFRGSDRSFSAGCVRVEDAQRLARWAVREAAADQDQDRGAPRRHAEPGAGLHHLSDSFSRERADCLPGRPLRPGSHGRGEPARSPGWSGALSATPAGLD
jgi:murein L,D-transpeptidase YcbB/YkuD